ncbi:MAG: transposase [Bellilinea sp.]
MTLPQRKHQRLKHFDYRRDGVYFLTICTFERGHLLGIIDNGVMHLNQFGEIIKSELMRIPDHHPSVSIDNFVVMPNHIHIIIVINNQNQCQGLAERSRPFPTVSTIVGLYKSGVTNKIHKINPSLTVWQKSFHDHRIRDENDYSHIWDYIEYNPMKWELDKYFT